jgi:hypothetical protein
VSFLHVNIECIAENSRVELLHIIECIIDKIFIDTGAQAAGARRSLSQNVDFAPQYL